MSDVKRLRIGMGIGAATAIVAMVGAALVLMPTAAVAGPSTVTKTFGYSGSKDTFTVPDGITQLTLTATGAEGGQGGADASGPSPTGGYQGVVTGTISVTPGQVLTIGVGGGGATGPSTTTGSSNSASYTSGAATGGSNPFAEYQGGNGGVAGYSGDSGDGGAGGAATVITTNGATIVAGGAGGSGGSGQFPDTLGRLAASSYSARSDATSTNGQNGITVALICNVPGATCDGGASGAGGGGVIGGAQGAVEFGAGTSDEWFGYGGFPGGNSAGGLDGLGASYQHYTNNSAAGSVTISYAAGAPDAPTAVSGSAGDTSVNLAWTAPTVFGQSAVTDYVLRYAPASDQTNWTTFGDATATNTSTTVTGLTDGTAYVFEVAAVNAVGTGAYSVPSAAVTPTGPPAEATISTVTPADGGLSVAFDAPDSGSPILGYDYQLDGGSWLPADTASSPLAIAGLTNGTTYSVMIRANSAIGSGPASDAKSGTPEAVPGAPTVTAVFAGSASATVSFTPGFSGGGAVSDYDYQLDGGDWISAGTTSSPITITGLAGGTTYSIAIRAVNGTGDGTASQASSVTTPGLPGAPTVTAIAAADSSASISFTPGDTGGLPVTKYQYQLTTGGPWQDAASQSSPIVVAGLSNGTVYSVSVRAVNAVGSGAASASQPVTPATVPGAPSITGNTVAGGDSQLSAAFTAPASDGGAAITGYEYSTDSGATWRVRTTGSTASPLIISSLSTDGTTPLVNGTTYHVELRAVNAVGAGTASALASGIAATVPSAPAISQVVAGPSSLQVAFAPASNGGAAITGYQYRLGSGDWTSTGTLGSSFLIPGLVNGTAYAVEVRAVNSQGNGTASSAVSGLPLGLPGQPTITDVTRANHSLTAHVSLADDGGTSVTVWQYTTDGGATWADAPGTTSPLTVTTLSSDGTTPLANGTGYAVAFRAENIVGTGVASGTTTVAPSSAPSAPTVSVIPLVGAIQVSYALAADGGSPVQAIEYSLDGGAHWTNAGSLASPFTIAPLSNGTAYAVLLRADNAIGNGAPSTPASTTPRTSPDAPTSVAALSNAQRADVSWSAPASDGGSSITGYVATAFASQDPTDLTPVSTCSTTTTSCSIGSLSNGTGYYVSVVAHNAAGSSVASTPRVLVTPLARLGAPTGLQLTAGDSFLTAAFTTVAGATGYDYQLNGGAWTPVTSTSSPITISGLTDGTSYSVALRAENAAGAGAASTAVTGVPYTFPDAPDPTKIVADGQDRQAVISWAAPDDNGSPIQNYSHPGDASALTAAYTVTAFSAASAGTNLGSCSTSGGLTCIIAGLSDGTTYWISIQAQNAAGLSVRSDPRVAVTPSTLPGAVTGVTGVAGDGQVALTWTPGGTGAHPISDYTIWYSSNGSSYTRFDDGISTGTSATVTGLTDGTPYTFEVYAVNSNGTGPVSAPSAAVTPLVAGTVPTLNSPTSTVDGYTFTISNYDSSANYAVTATNGSVGIDGSTVTVTGLDAGESSTVTVSATDPGKAAASASIDGSALQTGVVPTASSLTRLADGFSFGLSDDSPDYHYAVSVDGGASVALAGSTVTVGGLDAGTSATVTITTTRDGYTTATLRVAGSALVAGIAPELSAPVRTADGFTFEIGNIDPDADPAASYSVSATEGAAALSGSTVTVTGLDAGETSTVTVDVSLSGSTDASAAQTGSALDAGATPAFSDNTSTADGFTFTIANYDAGLDYAFSASNGAVVVASGADVVVSGLQPGQASDVVVTASVPGESVASSTASGVALLAADAPILSAVTPLAGGYSFDITNYSPDYEYSFVATGGGIVVRDGQTVTVSGLDASTASTTTVTATRAGYTTTTASTSGTSFGTGSVPSISPIVRTNDGFSFDIANYSADYSYQGTSAQGTVTIVGSTVTVTGLAAGESTTVHLVTSKPGLLDETADVTGTAIFAGVAPTLSAARPQESGYVFTITNYSSDFSYAFSATDHAIVTQNGGRVTVGGLKASASSTVTITATRDGYRTAAASITGAAMAAPAPAATSTPSGTAGDSAGTTSTPSGSHSSSPKPPVITESRPGKGAVMRDGKVVPSTLTSTSTRVVLVGDGLTMQIAATSKNKEIPLTTHQTIVVRQRGHLLISVKGFKIGTQASVWGFSKGVLLAQPTVTTPTLTHGFSLPGSIMPGDHTLVLTGTAANGQSATMKVGIIVIAAKAAAHQTSPTGTHGSGLGGWWWLYGSLAVILVLAIIFLVAWRRRRGDDDEELAGPAA